MLFNLALSLPDYFSLEFYFLFQGLEGTFIIFESFRNLGFVNGLTLHFI
eukprot:UN08242